VAGVSADAHCHGCEVQRNIGRCHCRKDREGFPTQEKTDGKQRSDEEDGERQPCPRRDVIRHPPCHAGLQFREEGCSSEYVIEFKENADPSHPRKPYRQRQQKTLRWFCRNVQRKQPPQGKEQETKPWG